MNTPTRYEQARQVTLLSALVNFLLAIVKMAVGWVWHSQALIADGVHSFSDLITDAVVLFAARMGAQAADRDHPYGHDRIETAATVFLAILVALVGAGIFLDAGARVLDKTAVLHPGWPVLVIAFGSIITKEALYRYTMLIGQRVDSQLLQANAWHHRSDALTSVIVLIGVFGVFLGVWWLDAVAAMVVSLFIIRMGWRLGWHSLRELIDTGIDDQTLNEIKSTIKAVSGVRTLHQLRTRTMAGKIFIDVHVLVGSKLSVSEGHYIGEQVRNRLIQAVVRITDVTVHVDPEDDELIPQSCHLSERKAVLALLQKKWEDIPEYQLQKTVQIHYLGGKLHVEVYLPLTCVKDQSEADILWKRFHSAIADEPTIASLKIWYS